MIVQQILRAICTVPSSAILAQYIGILAVMCIQYRARMAYIGISGPALTLAC